MIELRWLDFKNNTVQVLAEFQSALQLSAFDHALTFSVLNLQFLVFSLGDHVVHDGEIILSWVLQVWVNPATADGNTLQLSGNILAVKDQILGDSRDEVAGV